MSRYKSGDIVKYLYDDKNEQYTIINYLKLHRMIIYKLENVNGIQHECYTPSRLKLVKRLI
jgi:hypothetical protein